MLFVKVARILSDASWGEIRRRGDSATGYIFPMTAPNAATERPRGSQLEIQ
jgi:hypothetical protein